MLSGFGVVFGGLITLVLAAIPLMTGIRSSFGSMMAVILFPLVVFVAALTSYVWRDMRGKMGGVIALDKLGIGLKLPGGRSLLHHPPACHEFVPYEDVASVETRLEVYPSQGMSITQRAYQLTRHGKPAIFLFEDRALETFLATGTCQALALEIANRAGAPMNDLGMVKGRGGILGVWFVRVPEWSTSSLPAEEQQANLRRSKLTGSFAAAAVVIVIVLILISFL